MKTRPVTISIPEPCTQYIDKGTQLPGGRSYCGSCEKTLVNFYAMSDEELIAFLRNRSSIPCGVYRKDQLDRTFHVPLPQQSTPARKRLLWLVSLCMAWMAGAAQPATKPATGATKTAIVKPAAQASKKPPRFITGRVMNTGNMAVEGATVKSGGQVVFQRTGKDGYFRIDTRKFPGKTFDISHPFYSDCRVNITDGDTLEAVLQPKVTISEDRETRNKNLPDDDRYTGGRCLPDPRPRPDISFQNLVFKPSIWSRFRLVFAFGRKKP